MQGADPLRRFRAVMQVAGLRRTTRELALRGLEAYGAFRRARCSIAARSNTVVLTLHRIVPDAEWEVCRSPRGMVLRESMFVRLLEYLKATTALVSPDDHSLLDSRTGRPRVLITFDDGWADNFEVALPHLARADVKAHFFAVTEFVGKQNPFWPERMLSLLEIAAGTGQLAVIDDLLKVLQRNHEKKAPQVAASAHYEELLRWIKQFPSSTILRLIQSAEYRLGKTPHDACSTPALDPWDRLMTWEQLQLLVDAGHSVGSHTCTHAILPQLDHEQLARELGKSHRALQEHLRLPNSGLLWISYPNGSASASVVSAARNAHYAGAFLNSTGLWQKSTDRFLIPRVNVWDGTVMNRDGVFCERQLEYAIFWNAHNAATHPSYL